MAVKILWLFCKLLCPTLSFRFEWQHRQTQPYIVQRTPNQGLLQFSSSHNAISLESQDPDFRRKNKCLPSLRNPIDKNKSDENRTEGYLTERKRILLLEFEDPSRLFFLPPPPHANNLNWINKTSLVSRTEHLCDRDNEHNLLVHDMLVRSYRFIAYWATFAILTLAVRPYFE